MIQPEEEAELARMKESLEAQMRADQLFRSWFQTAVSLPDPAELRPLYRPMEFKIKKGKGFEIKTEAKQVVDVINMRNAILLGIRAVQMTFNKPEKWNKLIGKYGVMTTDTPNEIYTQYMAFQHMYGNVLVGGLGLGMAAELILGMPGVKSVTVIEKEPELIKLIQPQIDGRIAIVHADLFKYLKSPVLQYDSAYFDIWYGTGEVTWQKDVVPLYRLARAAGIHTLGAWCEYDMWSQLFKMLYTCQVMRLDHQWRPYRVFLDAAKGLRDDNEIMDLIVLYLTKIGTPKWEARFKWNARKKRRPVQNDDK